MTPSRPRHPLLAIAVVALAACNYGVFGSAADAGNPVCRCTCGAPDGSPDDDPCISECKKPFDSAKELAHEDGCDGEFAAYSTCLADEGQCTDRTFDAPSCGSRFSLLTRCELGSGMGGGGP